MQPWPIDAVEENLPQYLHRNFSNWMTQPYKHLGLSAKRSLLREKLRENHLDVVDLCIDFPLETLDAGHYRVDVVVICRWHAGVALEDLVKGSFRELDV